MQKGPEVNVHNNLCKRIPLIALELLAFEPKAIPGVKEKDRLLDDLSLPLPTVSGFWHPPYPSYHLILRRGFRALSVSCCNQYANQTE